MEILFYRYNSICEPDTITAFRKLGITVIEETTQVSRKDVSASQVVEQVGNLIQGHCFLFVFSINFFPALSEVCQLFQVPYVCWTVDVPVLELFSPSFANSCNRIFLFDRSQYMYFRDRNPGGTFYLPLATNTERWDRVVRAASSAEKVRFKSDISFVGSLYGEKNQYRLIKDLSEYARGYVQGIVEAQLQVYGVNFTESMLTDQLMKEMEQLLPDIYQPLCEGCDAARRYFVAHSVIGSELAQTERTRLLNGLAREFDVNLYTGSDAKELKGVHVHNAVETLTEMPVVFNSSGINLNITMRPIATGLSLRVYDICGAGGFLMTNWQEELPELYEPGAEAEYFTSEEELMDKAGYYLEHDAERKSIAAKGYERTKTEHTYDARIREMIRMVSATL
ncbi:MAG: DUF3880 domain-containing protein [Lachnospiraceae bacterium]|nr:DUF3880 domain-containing protein [Lachnospiraceae bacterium]